MSDWEDEPIAPKSNGFAPPKNDDDWGDSKATKTNDFGTSNTANDDDWGNSGGASTTNYDNANGSSYDGGDRPRGRGRGRGGFRGRGRGDYNGGGGGDRYKRNEDGGNDEWGGGDSQRSERGGFGGRGRGRGRGGGFGGDSNGRNRDGDNNTSQDNGDGETPKEKPREVYIPPEPTNDESEMFANHIQSGINFDLFDKIPVKCYGEDVPAQINSFETSGLREFLLNNIKKSGYTKPTPIQKYAIPIVLAKRDLMGCAQTGSGKTAAFLIPILQILLDENKDMSIGRPHCVIVAPTRELVIQIYNEARKFALASYLKVCIAYGGTASRYQGENIGKGCHLLVATPGRLMDFVEKTIVSFEDIRFVVLDEADRMLDMGFMPTIEKMMTHETMSERNTRQTLMFSATFPDEIQKAAGKFLNNYIFLTVGIVGGASTDVEQTIIEVSKFNKRDQLKNLLKELGNVADGILVFVETKRTADFLACLLSETTIPTTSIHGDRLQREREEALRDFRSGKMKLLIATSVAARGLDIKNVSHVVNYDLPKSIDDYVHRIGRTGRVGNRGKATSFYDPNEDSPLAQDLVKILTQAEQQVPPFLGSSGGDFGSADTFGARDIRKGPVQAQVQAIEPEEEW